MKLAACVMLCGLLLPAAAEAAKPVTVDSEGYACMGDDRSRKQTEKIAFLDSKRRGMEQVLSYLQSETIVKDAVVERDSIAAYTDAKVKVVEEIRREWYKDAAQGECYRVKLKVQIVPDEKRVAPQPAKKLAAVENDPTAPLNVQIWTDRTAYADKEPMRILIRGNKPFYGRVLYQQSDGSTVQLLPNAYRKQNYFNGGTVYELPAGRESYRIEASPPYGKERVILQARTSPPVKKRTTPVTPIHLLEGQRRSGLTGAGGVNPAGGANNNRAAEVAEAVAEIEIRKK